MFNIIDACFVRSPVFVQTKTKSMLIISSNLILCIGYADSSKPQRQQIYEVYDMTLREVTYRGHINSFGVIQLTPYVAYQREGSFITVIKHQGSRKIMLNDFIQGEFAPIIKEIKYCSFQQDFQMEKNYLSYSSKTCKILFIQMLVLPEHCVHICIRVFAEEEGQLGNYRLILMEKGSVLPQIVFLPTQIAIIETLESKEHEFGMLSITIFKEQLTPLYHHLSILEGFDVLGYCYEMIIQLKENKHIFTMSLQGTLKPMVECETEFLLIDESTVCFKVISASSSHIECYEYEHGEKLFKRKSKLVIGSNFQLLACRRGQMLLKSQSQF